MPVNQKASGGAPTVAPYYVHFMLWPLGLFNQPGSVITEHITPHKEKQPALK